MPVATEEALHRFLPWHYPRAMEEGWRAHGFASLGTPMAPQRAADTAARGDDVADFQSLLMALPLPEPFLRSEAHDELCAVCHEPLSKGERLVRRLPCTHRFHDGCIIPWLRKNPICPLDRCQLAELLGTQSRS
mmetsp:Transcript_89763/g.200586  ORF Transcript_89763/g.200586 Transcript_89763/m.200586 type:complete len:134 (+) Transcript_89763:92-493(+)